ncbi:MAG TPA: hypothetical protein PLS10_08270, partial [Chitinophagales bacterium]|nr:hypothetical protein [Chitinophagales bacterium]
IFKCKGDNKCISTDWKENGKEEYTQFTKGSSYNYQELADLLNNFRDDYLGKKSNSSSTSGVSANTSTPNLQTALTELNAYMKTFDGDRYKGMEVKDGYVFSNYSNNNYSKAKVEDLDYVKLNTEFKYIKLACKGDNKCVYSTITGSYHEYFNFQTSTGKDLNKMVGLLENFLAALKGKNTISTSTPNTAMSIREQKEKERQKQNTTATDDDVDDYFGLFTDAPTTTTKSSTPASTTKSSTPDPVKYTKALNALNDYLKIFNAEVYKGVEVKEGKVFFNFYVYGTNYNSSIPINDLTQNTTVIKGKSVGSVNDDEIKIFCKGDKKYFYSSYNKSDADHFRFFSRTVKDLTKMKQLVEEFITALK